jgi:hypothetical protein
VKQKSPYQAKNPAPPVVASWDKRVRSLLLRLAKDRTHDAGYLLANCDAVYRTVDGRGPDKETVHPGAGARITFNLSAVHVPGFCEASKDPAARAFKNCYDVADNAANSMSHNTVAERRQVVDGSLPLPANVALRDVYFGAVDINGTGVRFYGDVCLVLHRHVAESCIVLDRNSYDVIRSPIREQVARLGNKNQALQSMHRSAIVKTWSGAWNTDLRYIVATKAFAALPLTARRWTTGHISQAVCSDEDYIEVLQYGSFKAIDLQEARIASYDVAEDALTASRQASRRPAPRLEAMLWARRRARAETALRALGVPVRTMGHHGRVRN